MARRSDDPVITAARNLVETLSKDPAFVAEVTATEIERRIDAGLLIPAERLQIASGLRLVPAERVQHLEDLVVELVDALGDTMPADLAARFAELMPEESPQPEGGESTPNGDAEPDGDPTEEPTADAEGATEPAESEAAPERPKLPTEAAPCAECGATELIADGDEAAQLNQAQLAFIRFRKILCRPCMAEH